ncbi:hypothetical protein Tco_0077655, partial [Tanacetum coccineum]
IQCSPSGIALGWVKLLVHSWSRVSKSVAQHGGGEVSLSDLTRAEMNTLLAVNVKDHAYEAHLRLILADSRLSRAMLAILCPL